MLLRVRCLFGLLSVVFFAGLSRAEEPLAPRVDSLITAKAAGRAVSPSADDGEFVRRAYLDLVGRIPSIAEVRGFLADTAADKHGKLIDQLLANPEHARRMQEWFHLMFVERRGDDAEWIKYLRDSFAANKPWDQMVREIINPNPQDEATRASAYFISKRLENYGQNPVDYPALTRDVGRLMLGVDLQCAQCHNHLFIDDYKQHDFQGLFVIFQNTSIRKDVKFPALAEKPIAAKLEFMSVFDKIKHETGPRLPGRDEMEVPTFEKGQEFLEPPDRKTNFPGKPKFSPLAKLSEQLPTPENPAFARNMVNRLWFLLMGRGLVHPLDLHHSGNPASHPELLDLLSQEFVAHKYDIRWLLGELARTQTYQRSSILPEGPEAPPELFLTAIEKRVSAEQLIWSVLEATGERERLATSPENTPEKPAVATKADALRPKFIKAFANPPMEPENEIAPSLQAALFVLNDVQVLEMFKPQAGNLVDRLSKLSDPAAIADELYLSVLSRLPSAEEKAEVGEMVKIAGDTPAVVSASTTAGISGGLSTCRFDLIHNSIRNPPFLAANGSAPLRQASADSPAWAAC